MKTLRTAYLVPRIYLARVTRVLIRDRRRARSAGVLSFPFEAGYGVPVESTSLGFPNISEPAPSQVWPFQGPVTGKRPGTL